jgi:hypothetical protein
MARRGLNCTLSYSDGNRLRQYRIRCDMASEGTVMVYEESQARLVRAFYPHRTAQAPFQIRAVLIGQKERKSFTNWLDGYAGFVLDPDLRSSRFPPMTVNLPSRRFIRVGVPLSGFEYGDHVGSMVWNHVITFESIPVQLSTSNASRPGVVPTAIDPQTEFFYPFGDQLSGDKAGAVYTQIITTLAPSQTTPDTPRYGRPVED